MGDLVVGMLCVFFGIAIGIPLFAIACDSRPRYRDPEPPEPAAPLPRARVRSERDGTTTS